MQNRRCLEQLIHLAVTVGCEPFTERHIAWGWFGHKEVGYVAADLCRVVQSRAVRRRRRLARPPVCLPHPDHAFTMKNDIYINRPLQIEFIRSRSGQTSTTVPAMIFTQR
jgi:hypothetical protein